MKGQRVAGRFCYHCGYELQPNEAPHPHCQLPPDTDPLIRARRREAITTAPQPDLLAEYRRSKAGLR